MRIKEEVKKRLVAHAKRDAPIEACGYLAGRDGVITGSYELKNIDRSTEHFSFDPKEQFAVMKEARAGGFEILAVYHSHPASPARPSKEDITLAYDPNILYVIVSLAEGREDVKAFEIKNQKVSEINLETIKDDRI